MTQTQTCTSRLPIDVALLEPLGLVIWASARLRTSARDWLGKIDGELSDEPFDLPFEELFEQLRQRAVHLEPAQRERIETWIDDLAEPAVRGHHRVVHAIPHESSDGTQALGYRDGGRFLRLTPDDVREIADDLAQAAVEFPDVPA